MNCHPLGMGDHKEFLNDLKEEGYHIFSKESAKKDGFYPSSFPDYPTLQYSDLSENNEITIRAFFPKGPGPNPQIDSGQIRLEVELVENDKGIVWGNILTDLPSEYPLSAGSTIELSIDEVLFVH